MIETDLMPILFAAAKAADLGVGSDCEQEVRRFIQSADTTYRKSSPAQQKTIRNNFEKFAAEMVVEAKRRGLRELRESTFHAARVSLCPLFPFC